MISPYKIWFYNWTLRLETPIWSKVGIWYLCFKYGFVEHLLPPHHLLVPSCNCLHNWKEGKREGSSRRRVARTGEHTYQLQFPPGQRWWEGANTTLHCWAAVLGHLEYMSTWVPMYLSTWVLGHLKYLSTWLPQIPGCWVSVFRNMCSILYWARGGGKLLLKYYSHLHSWLCVSFSELKSPGTWSKLSAVAQCMLRGKKVYSVDGAE